jgi:phenylalanyl-tRNA synthetase beta chain
MKISFNWLNDFVNLEDIDINTLTHKFTMSTAEVDDVIKMGQDIQGVIVGLVKDVRPHPESKKLSICTVDTGNGTIQSLCGAPNVKPGIKVPFAGIGASIKKVPKVTGTIIAGQASNGILCSALEIGLSDNHEGLLILPDDYVVGADIKQYIDLDDVIIEIDNKSLTNRPDLWGHYGTAREFAAIFGRKLQPLHLEEPKDGSLPMLDIEIRDTKKCFRYASICISNATGAKTPFNMQVRLYYCGMRPIEPLVDLTNYIMLEIGQPMHAFDRRFIGKIIVDSTSEEIMFRTLDSIERNVPKDTLMIYNQDGPVAIAGIMGGENSEISKDTDAIFLESATFSGPDIRKGSTRLGLRTEASARYEKCLDTEYAIQGVKRFIKLFRSIKPDIVIESQITDVYPVRREPVKISIEKRMIDNYVGESLPDATITRILESLEFKVKQTEGGFEVEVPSFRATKDISIKADLVEEITRVYGYDNIKPASVNVLLKPLDFNAERADEHKIKEILAESFGLNEVNSYVWYDDDFNKRSGIKHNGNLKIANPHAPNANVLRDSMVPSLLQMAEGNSRYFDSFGIFEVGSVFKLDTDSGQCQEHKNLCVLCASKDENEDNLFLKLKGIFTHIIFAMRKLEAEYNQCDLSLSWVHPSKSLIISASGNELGYLTIVHPAISENIDKKLKLAVLEVRMDILAILNERNIVYCEPSRYQDVNLDFSFLADNAVSFEQFRRDVDDFKHELLMACQYIDIYTGKGLPEGKKSLTFRFVMGSRQRTLSSEEISSFSVELLKYMKEKGYILR